MNTIHDVSFLYLADVKRESAQMKNNKSP